MNVAGIISMAANVATAVGVIFAVYTYHRDTRRKAKQDTIEAYNQLKLDALNELYKPFKKRQDNATDSKSEYWRISNSLTYVESFCACINAGIYDFDLFYEIAHGYFDSKNGNFRKRVDWVLNYKQDTFNDDYYKNLNLVWKNMKKEKEKRKLLKKSVDK